MTAMRLVQRMKRDWMHTGRRPSGLCGAGNQRRLWGGGREVVITLAPRVEYGPPCQMFCPKRPFVLSSVHFVFNVVETAANVCRKKQHAEDLRRKCLPLSRAENQTTNWGRSASPVFTPRAVLLKRNGFYVARFPVKSFQHFPVLI